MMPKAQSASIASAMTGTEANMCEDDCESSNSAFPKNNLIDLVSPVDLDHWQETSHGYKMVPTRSGAGLNFEKQEHESLE